MEEKTLKVSIINEDGQKIVKEVPENLYSQYINMGWKPESEFVEPKESSKKSFSEK